jgi:hypothetical protein
MPYGALDQRVPDRVLRGRARAHLDGCLACREEHQSLYALVSGERAL